MNPKSLSQETAALAEVYSRDADLQRQAEISEKAERRFRKSRQGIGKAFIGKGKRLAAALPEHPDFRGWSSEAQKALLRQFAEFKPKQTFFESRDGRKLRNHAKVMHAIGKLERIRNRAAIAERVRREIRSKGGVREESLFEMDEAELRAMVRARAARKSINASPFRRKFFVETVPSAPAPRKQARSVFGAGDRNREWELVALADQNAGLVSRQKKVWHARKKKYVGVTVDAAGQSLDARREQQREYLRKTGKLKKKFGAWKRAHNAGFGTEGEAEDRALTAQMRRRFSERKRQNFRTVKPGAAQERARPGAGRGGKKQNRRNKIRKQF